MLCQPKLGGIKYRVPRSTLDGIDPRHPPARFETYVCVEQDASGGYSDLSLPNAVARICLEPVQGELPQWGRVTDDGAVKLGRQYRPEANRPVRPMPRHLFTINWADSGPGFSWPEAYYVTYLLGYHHHIVTAAQDSSDVFGYTELAIGHFPASGEDIEEPSGEVLRNWWRSDLQASSPWEYFWEAGLIDEETAEGWALEAWEYQSGFDGDTPDWYQAKLPRTDQHTIRRFKRLLESGVSLEELPDDLRRWWKDFA